MKIVSEIKVNGEWVDQETLSKETAAKIIEETIKRAGRTIGFEVTKKRKTA